MNLKLAEYISKWLAPKEYRLELKNRLENLCALSGTPMSPGLHQWVTDKFGLEMTRVIEDYSTFTSPKLSPELLSVVDRIVPSNYQGEDVNLYFRQLFDVTCSSNKCIWFGTVDDRTTSLNFQNPSASWTGNYWVNGVDGQTNYQPQLGVFSAVLGYDISLFIVWSLEDGGAEPVGWTGNGIPLTWEKYDCDLTKGCFKTQGVFTTGSTTLYLTEIGLASGYTLNLAANGLDAYTIDDPVILTYLQGIFGGDAIITVNVNYAAGTYSIEIDNVYNINAPISFGLFDGISSYTAVFTDCTRPKCIAWADNIVTAENCSFNGFSWSINNSIFPTLGNWWEIGVDIQSQYQLDAGGGVVSDPGGLNGCGGFLWSLEDDPIGTNWQVMTSDTYVINPIIWNGQSCDLSKGCYEVDMPVDITDFTNDFTFTSPNGNITLENTGFQLNDPNFILLLQSIFGGQSTITLNDNVTSVYIKIENCYTAIHPVELSILFNGSYLFTPCTP